MHLLSLLISYIPGFLLFVLIALYISRRATGYVPSDFPRSPPSYAAAIGVSLILSLQYWIVSVVAFPTQSLDTIALYRFGDLQYYPIIRAFSHLEFQPTYDPSITPEGISTLGVGSILIHAASFRLFGTQGLIVADVLAVGVFAVAMHRILTRIDGRNWLSILGIVCAGLLWTLPHFNELSFYTLRIPRPLVANLWFLLFFAEALEFNFLRSEFLKTKRSAAYLGALTGLLLLSGPWWFVVVALFLGFTFLHDLALVPSTAKKIITRYAIAGVMFAVIASPAVIQLFYGSNDLNGRLGVFTITDRWALVRWFLFAPTWRNFVDAPLDGLTGHAPTNALVAVFYCVMACLTPTLARHRPKLLAMTLLLLAALIAPFLCFLFAPSEVQPYHHFSVLSEIGGLALFLVTYLMVVEVLRVGSFAIVRTLAYCLASIALIVTGLSYFYVAGFIVRTTEPREDLFRVVQPKTYRDDFVATTVALDRVEFHSWKRPMQLLTNDYLIMTWWLMKGYGGVQMPDAFEVVLSDSDLEKKVIDTGKILGWSPDLFLRVFTETSSLILFLSHNKYQAWVGHTWGPLADYPTDLVDQIKRESNPWSVIVPLSEKRRLRREYEQRSADEVERPDLIVLTCYVDWPCGSVPNRPDLTHTRLGNIDLYLPLSPPR